MTLNLPSMGASHAWTRPTALYGASTSVDATVTVGAATVSVNAAGDAMATAISDAVAEAGFHAGAVVG